jgi:multidrug efflux pump subunit AcrB/outer membrane protein TolC
VNPVRASLRNPQVTTILTLLVVALGLHALLNMPRREDPKTTMRMGLITAVYPGATAEQVEEQVTRRVEERLFRFEEVRRSKTYSTSRPGMMVVNVELGERVSQPDEFWSKLRHELNELRYTDLPDGVLGPVVNSEFGDILAVLLSVQGERYGYRELLPHVERIEDELRQMPEVSKIRRIGEQREQIRVTSTMQRLAQYGITPLHIVGGLQQQNVVADAGAFDAERSRVALRATGLFQSEEQVRRQIVGVSPSGQPIYIGDFARVERGYADPDFLVRVNATPALLLSLEMHVGHNIVDFGRRIDEKVEQLRAELPPDLEITLIVDQPRLVRQRIGHFMSEFGTALLAVILATMLLLPLPVATIAAMAIPVTIALTLFVLRAIGVELHQVSLAGLIVALGMVVDDAIVISDNYVSMLDDGVDRDDAAWRSASELAGPVLTSTLTIIAAFVPLLLLRGTTGEFIAALPITVSVALVCSSIVAMFLTPILCRLFIRSGMKEAIRTSARFRPLELLQASYDRAITYFMAHRRLALGLGALAVLAGLGLLSTVEERFFPPAERDQFAMNVRLPEGARFDATDDAVRRIEAVLGGEDEVVSYATFIGGGAPRFFFSFEPAMPAPNVAQVMVNTTSADATRRVVSRLRASLPSAVPEAEVVVDELQQGIPTASPVEVRISGSDIGTLRRLGADVADVIRTVPFSALVRDDYREDVYSLQVVVRPEVANRLGMSNELIASSLAGTFLGAPVSTLWQGTRAVDIVLRLDETHRESFEHVGSTYLISSVSGARVPLREIASLEPVWQPGRIVRRNGVRTLTVGAHAQDGWLASEVVNALQPRLAAVELPQGYRMEWGGEHEAQEETFAQMVTALLVSLFAIFLILLFTFRDVRAPLIIMVSIPLALFGAALGLVLTRNPFGFTAFLGLISLSGIVVRNGVILVEYMRDQEAIGVDARQAALDAGKRRLRPIFLTSASAAAGLTPMILSGSGLWAPLASVLAVGLMCSMVFTLIIVPVLYSLTSGRPAPAAARETDRAPRAMAMSGGAAVLLVALCLPAPAAAQAAQRLTLDEAVTLARAQSHGVLAARADVDAVERRAAHTATSWLPRLTTEVSYSRSTAPQGIRIPAGSLGEIPGAGPFPGADMALDQGEHGLVLAVTTLTQPLTHGFSIREGVALARLEADAARARLHRVESQVALAAIASFAALLGAQYEADVARLRHVAATARTTHAQAATGAGAQLTLAAADARVTALAARQRLLEAENAVDDAMHALAELLALPHGTTFELVMPAAPSRLDVAAADLIDTAMTQNPDVIEARIMAAQATHGVRAARADYIPEIGIVATHIGQSGAPFVPRSSVALGLRMHWTVWDFGARRHVSGERAAQRRQAESNLAMVEARVRGAVEKAHRALDRSWQRLELAREAELLRDEAMRLRQSQAAAGLVLDVELEDAAAAHAQATLDRLRAELGYRAAGAELMALLGTGVTASGS